MRIIRNSLIPWKGFKCINLFGVLFVRKECEMSTIDINHESIHTAQMKELWYVGFYVWYLLEWLYRLIMEENAYRSISFEREAYSNQNDMYYLNVKREKFAWLKYL